MESVPYEQVLAALPDGITVQDRDFNIVYQNNTMRQTLGSHVGERCYAVYERRDGICEGCGVQEAFQTGEPNMVLRTAFGADGTTSYWENSCFPLCDTEGNIVAGVEVCRSVTDRVSLEEEVKDGNVERGQLNKRLNQRMVQLRSLLDEHEGIELQLRKEMDVRGQAERDLQRSHDELKVILKRLETTQVQMRQSEKLASIGQLAAGVAHEMNTPVGFVASNFKTLEGYVKKIRDLLVLYDRLVPRVVPLEDPGLRNLLAEIDQFRSSTRIDFILEDIQGLFDDSREGLERVTTIVRNLRDFSRIDQPGSRDEYDLNEGIKATLVVARNEIKYDADVRTELSEIPLIFCHGGQVNQVLLNILVNAAQAIKSQKRGDGDRGTITIRTRACEDGVVCEITDDGPRIAPEHLARIFEPFFTTKAPGKGTGLGLSVSYDIIVHKHNGRLLVDSEVGRGTTFTIELPIGTREDDEQETMSDGTENRVICGR